MGTQPQPSPEPSLAAEYESLKSYFKWLVGATYVAILLFAGVGAVFLYKSIGDIRSDAKQAASDALKNATERITFTADRANSELARIKDDSARVAQAEAQKRVEEVFAKPDIQAMLQSAAKKQVGAVISREVKDEVERSVESVHEDMQELSVNANAAMRMRLGLRSGLTELIERSKTAPAPLIRQNAAELLTSIALDYDQVIKAELARVAPNTPAGLVQMWVPKAKGIAGVVDFLRTEGDLNRVAYAFAALRELTGDKFRMFDLDGVDNWCKQNQGSCN